VPKGEHNSDRSNKRTPSQIQLDRAEMVTLLRRGWTKKAIAAKFGLHETQISYDWKRVLMGVQDDMRDESELAVIAQLERNAEVEREAWQAWEKSKDPAHKHVLERRRRVVKVEGNEDGGDGEGTGAGGEGKPATEVRMEPERETTTTEQKVGDPRFLGIVQTCQEVERDLRGITPATRVMFGGSVDHNHQGAVAVGVFPWDALAGVAGAQLLLGKGVDGRPVDPFGEAMAQALGLRGLPAPEGTVLPAQPPPQAPPTPQATEPPPPPDPAPATTEDATATTSDDVPAEPNPNPSPRKHPSGGRGKSQAKGGKGEPKPPPKGGKSKGASKSKSKGKGKK
jgi:hypothetical protein